MTPLEVLKDPHAAPSSVWCAVEALLGKGASAYEPETLHLELERRGVPWDDNVSAKVMGAQTILTTRAWTHDHDVLFAFAMACDGHPAGGISHPTVVQIAWAISEIEELTGSKLDDDVGFDPDGVDPAVAAVLHDDGWVLAPLELAFCQDALSGMDKDDGSLRGRVEAVWDKLKPLPENALRALVGRAPEDALGIQIARLADCEIELRERSQLRATHHDGTGT